MDVPMSPTAEWSDKILVLWGTSINTDPFSSTVFLFCSPLETHIPLFLRHEMPWVVMEHCTRDLLFLLCDRMSPHVTDISQAGDSLSPKPTSRRTLVLINCSGTCKGKCHWAIPPMHRGEGIEEKSSGTHFGDTQTKWKSLNVIKVLFLCTF